MFFLTQPRDSVIREFLLSQRNGSFSYPEVGATASDSPASYNVDHYRIKLGEGEELFARACDAIRRWAMFDLGWVRLVNSDAPIERGATVAVLARHLGFWSLNACRVVYVVDEEDSLRKRFGFAYGTLADHIERGEERFTVELNRGEETVWYNILAFSRPNQLLIKLGYPVARLLQKRFGRDSTLAMLREVQGTCRG